MYKSGVLLELVSPIRPCRDLGEKKIRECDRGWLVKPNKLAHESSGAAGTRCGVPVAEGPHGPSAAHSARVSNSKESGGGVIVSFNRTVIDSAEKKKVRVGDMTGGSPEHDASFN